MNDRLSNLAFSVADFEHHLLGDTVFYPSLARSSGVVGLSCACLLGHDSCCKGIPKEIRSLLASYEPYDGGEEVVWAINELCRASKHRIIIPVNPGASVVFSHFEVAGGTSPVYVCDGQSILCDENEVIIARTELGSKYNYKATIAFGVAFGPVRPIEGREVFPNLNRMRDAVSVIVNELEQECKKISLI